ncbi:MAG: DUF4412 domain-containing protein [Bacteroidota bacterium]
MKKLCLAIIALITTTAAVRSQSFEGSYLMHIETAQKKSIAEMQISIKGDKSCMEMITAPNEGKFRTIFDKKEKTMTILVDKDGTNKMAMVRKMPDATEYSGKEGKEPQITVTTETKKIEGYTCKKVIAESDESTTEMWVTDELGLTYSDMFGMMSSARGPASNVQNYKDVKGMPLEMNIKSKNKPDGDTVITLKNIKKGDMDASLFDTTGYQVMDMSKMGGGR